ncbi:hypothetical protein GGR44_002554 [Sphingobium fontiphilum]|uniref:TNase-like domain-containing protein n=1 Tax=Sphingobium fontiphilum TaxID=944425 RepID=A0A7W6DPR4_9SPHN|nr:hypothetical protein [Sphingobium fontiphilum]
MRLAWVNETRATGHSRFKKPLPKHRLRLPGIGAMPWLLGIVLAALWFAPTLPDWMEEQVDRPAPDALSAEFALCHSGGGANCVVDGDTFWLAGEKYRIADIDTPETHPPRCESEAELGARATERLQALLNDGPFSLESGERETDRYGRNLRIVTRDGQSIGAMLVSEGLARPWEGSRRPWC